MLPAPVEDFILYRGLPVSKLISQKSARVDMVQSSLVTLLRTPTLNVFPYIYKGLAINTSICTCCLGYLLYGHIFPLFSAFLDNAATDK